MTNSKDFFLVLTGFVVLIFVALGVSAYANSPFPASPMDKKIQQWERIKDQYLGYTTGEQPPLFSVINATTVMNEETGDIFTLKAYKPTPNIAEGRVWLADVAFKPNTNAPAFNVKGCKRIAGNAFECDDILMNRLKGDSIIRTGITSGNMQKRAGYEQ